MSVFRSLALVVGLFLTAASGWAAPLGDLIQDLRDVEAELAANQDRIEALQAEVGRLQTLGVRSEAEVLRLQTLLQGHTLRVQRLVQDLEDSRRLNLILGGTAAAVVLVALAEGVILAVR